MDPISHVVFGSALIRARRLAPLPRGSSVAIALGALAPDIDLAVAPFGWDRYLLVHEIGTHSLVGAAVFGAAAAGVAWRIRRPAEYRRLAVYAIVAALSHVLADLLSGASIRIAWPFLDMRVQNLGAFAMLDPYLVTLFAFGGLLMWRWTAQRSRVAIVLLSVLTGFVALKTISREIAEAAYRADPRAATRDGDYLVEPVWASMISWRVIDKTAALVRSWETQADGLVLPHVALPQLDTANTLVSISTNWETVRNFRRAHDYAVPFPAPDLHNSSRVTWTDIRYCARNSTLIGLECSILVGGEILPSDGVRLIVRVGELVQTR